jgi:hypothetical protein
MLAVSGHSQVKTPPSLKAIKDLLRPVEVPGEGESIEWMACDEDSTYYRSDTIQLYRNAYYYLESDCCRFVQWHLSPKYTFTLSEFRPCQEPPVSGVRMENQDLKFEINGFASRVTIAVLRKKQAIDTFEVIDLRTVTLPNRNETSQRLTLKRIRS